MTNDPNKISTERKRELFDAALAAFRAFCDPFSTAWLADHHVTLNEAAWLSETIADAPMGFDRPLGAIAQRD